MKTTLLDDYVQVCLDGQQIVPAFQRMVEVIKETVPVVYLWRDGKLGDPLPAELVQWQHPAFLLWTPKGVMPDRYRFAVDVDSAYDDPEFKGWFNRSYYLEGVFVFTRPGYERFDAIPVARQTSGKLIMADAQLSYELTPAGWAWQYAQVGPNNWFFHSWFRHALDEAGKAQVDDNVDLLGNTITRYLGAYWQYLQQPGEWFTKEPRASKVKLNKHGKIRKIIKPGTVGYKEWKINAEERREEETVASACDAEQG